MSENKRINTSVQREKDLQERKNQIEEDLKKLRQERDRKQTHVKCQLGGEILKLAREELERNGVHADACTMPDKVELDRLMFWLGTQREYIYKAWTGQLRLLPPELSTDGPIDIPDAVYTAEDPNVD